jgi:hypothetical protein
VQPPALRYHTTAYASRVIHLTRAVPVRPAARQPAIEARTAATAAASHYRSACLARSPRASADALHAAIEALEDSVVWLQLVRLLDGTSREEIDGTIRAGLALAASLTRLRRATSPR